MFFLCAMDLHTYKTHAHVRELFIELATEVLNNRDCPQGSGVISRQRFLLPE
jgi:hypothetical protein